MVPNPLTFVLARFAGGAVGSSSSSPLDVRSITALIVLLPFIAPLAAVEDEEGSLERPANDAAGVLKT